MKGLLLLLALLVLGYFLAPLIAEAPNLVLLAIGAVIFLFLAITNFELALLFLLFLIPLSTQANLSHASGGAPIDIGTDDIFICLLFVIWLVYLAKTQQAPFVKNPMTLPFMCYLVACVLSLLPMIISQKGDLSLSSLHIFKWFEYVFIYFVVVKSLANRDMIIRFTLLALGSCILIASIQAVEIVFGLGRTSANLKFGSWATASFESNGILGAFYLFFLPMLVSFLVSFGQRLKIRMMLIGLSALVTITLFYTFNRSAYVGLVIAIAVLGTLHRKQFRFILILVMLMLPAYFSKVISKEITQTITVDADTLKAAGFRYHGKMIHNRRMKMTLDMSSRERLIVWKKTKKLILNNVFLGVGYWNSRFFLHGFTPHNQYLTIFMDTGILGVLTFFWIFFNLIVNALRFSKTTEDPFYGALTKGFIAGVAGVLVHAFFGETFESFRLIGPLWMMTGIIFAAKRLDDEQIPYKEAYPGAAWD